MLPYKSQWSHQKPNKKLKKKENNSKKKSTNFKIVEMTKTKAERKNLKDKFKR